MTARFIRPLAALLVPALVVLAGCTVNPATGRQTFTPFMSPQEEQRVGREQHPKIVEEFGGVYQDPKVNAYVKGIGQSLARHAGTPHVSYTFTVLNSSVVNAFALPGGYVYVTRGLLALANTEAELAGVLAHETGHVAARHTAERYSETVVASVLAGLGGAALGGGPMANVLGAGAALAITSHSREQELESDTLGVRYLSAESYDPRAMATFLKQLGRNAKLQATLAGRPEAADQFDMLSTHPRTEDRVEAATQAAGVRPVTAPKVGGFNYLQAVDGLYVDGDRVNGFVKERRFVHPGERFAVTLPEGFRVVSSGANGLAAVGPDNAVAQMDWKATDQTNPDPQTYLTRVWAAEVALQNVERFSVGGRPAATGTVQVQQGNTRADARLVVVRTGPRRVHRFAFVTPAGASQALGGRFRTMTDSLRLLSESEAAAAEPLRITLAQAKAGDTVATLAARLPYDDHQELRFRTLNGLDPNDTIGAGQWLKMVVE